MEIVLFLVTMLISAIMVLLCVWVHYEALLMISALLPKLHAWFDLKKRLQIIAVVLGVFAAHTIEIWLFALCYYLMIDVMHYGTIAGLSDGSGFFEYLYFSTVNYTSLGLGEIHPTQYVRFIVGAEALIGLVMIGWSASFTYLIMEKFWNFKK